MFDVHTPGHVAPPEIKSLASRGFFGINLFGMDLAELDNRKGWQNFAICVGAMSAAGSAAMFAAIALINRLQG